MDHRGADLQFDALQGRPSTTGCATSWA